MDEGLELIKKIDEQIQYYLLNTGKQPGEILLTLSNFNKIKPYLSYTEKDYPAGTYMGIKVNVGIEMKWKAQNKKRS